MENQKDKRKEEYVVFLPNITVEGTSYGSIPQVGLTRATSTAGAVSCYIRHHTQGKTGIIVNALKENIRGGLETCAMPINCLGAGEETTSGRRGPQTKRYHFDRTENEWLRPYALATILAHRDGGTGNGQFERACNILSKVNLLEIRVA
jgi:hypothetical protein